MRGAREVRPQRIAVVLAFLLPLVRTTSAHAEPDVEPEPLRVVVRTIVPLDDALYERTVGQVSDLPVKVERAPAAALEPSMSARLTAARSLAKRADAAMIVWFEHPREAGPIVFIALPSRERILVRHVAVAPTDVMARSTSAMLEAASLVVRNALLAFESGATLGVPDDELMRQESDAPAPDEPSESRPPPRPERPAPPPRTRPRLPPTEEPAMWRPFVGAGWQLTIDGWSRSGARAGVLEGGVRYRRWATLARGSLGLPSHTHDELASLEVHRHSANILFGYMFARTTAFEVEGLAGGGAIIFRRAAFARDASFAPTAPVTLTTAAGIAELRVSWVPAPTFPIRLGLSAGADVLVQAPSFSYETPRGLVEHPSWFLEPRLGFTVLFQP